MRSPINSRIASAGVGAVLAMGLVIASTAAVDAKPPKPSPKPTPTATSTPTRLSVSATVEIAPTGTLEPSRQYSNVDVTVTCPEGWTWTRGSLYVRQAEPGGSGSFTASCTGTANCPREGRQRQQVGARSGDRDRLRHYHAERP